MKRASSHTWTKHLILFFVLTCSSCVSNSSQFTPLENWPDPLNIEQIATKTIIAQTPTLDMNNLITVSPTATITELTITKAITSEPKTVTPLKLGNDYILYTDLSPEDQQYQIWALDPNDPKPFLIIKGLIPVGYSPSFEYWLLSADHTIYVANSDGTDIRKIYQNRKYSYLRPVWLSDTMILFNAYVDPSSVPDIIGVNIDTGETNTFDLDGKYFIQAVSPVKEKWIIGNWDDGHVEVMDLSGKTKPILDDYQVDLDYFNFDKIQFLENGVEFLFLGTNKGTTEFGFWRASLVDPSIERLFEPEGIGSILDYSLSPNGQYVGYIFEMQDPEFKIGFHAYDLHTGNLAYQWEYPYSISSGYFYWSPDSKSIVFPYQSVGFGEPVTSGDIAFGIQEMEVASGEIKVLLNKNVMNIVGWQLFE